MRLHVADPGRGDLAPEHLPAEVLVLLVLQVVQHAPHLAPELLVVASCKQGCMLSIQ